jgi:large subunit ribosomal protein LP1
MGSKAEIACVYSALILADDDVAITGEKIQTVLKDSSEDWPGLFAKTLEGINVKDLITNVGSGVGGDGAAPGRAAIAVVVTEAAPAEKKQEAKKEEESEESDDDMGFGLFEQFQRQSSQDTSIILQLHCTLVKGKNKVLFILVGKNPGGGEIFRTRPDRPWGPPSLLYNGYRVFPGGKAARA